MHIFVLRHGQAELQETTDEARNLTNRGRFEVASMVKASANDLKIVQEIWASPLVRAQQTAKIAKDILEQHGVSLQIKTTELLIPEADTDSICAELERSKLKTILLVSHQPFVSEFFDTLCSSAKGFHSFDTSSIGYVDCESVATGVGKLRWLRHVHG